MPEELKPSGQLHQVAMLLRALQAMDMEMAEFKTDWKDRRTRLENELAKLRDEILDGQQTLPLAGD